MTHKWTCLLRSPEGEDLSYFIRKVVFELDPSFVNPRRTLTAPPYEVSEAGWGEFFISIKIHLVDESLPHVEMSHFLRLNPTGGATANGPCVASETYDELLIHEPTEWLYEKITSGATTELPPHPLSPYFLRTENEQQQQLKQYLGLQGYVQSESMKMMQDAFVLTMRIQELQRQHEAITNNVATSTTQAGVKQSQEVDNSSATGGHSHVRTGGTAPPADTADPAAAVTNATQASSALYATHTGLVANSSCADQQQHLGVPNHARGLQQQPQVTYHNQQAPVMQPHHVSHPQQQLLQHQHQQLVHQPQQFLPQQHGQQVLLQQPIIQQQQIMQ